MSFFIKKLCFTALGLSISILASAQSDSLAQSILLEALNQVDKFKENFESQNPSSIIDQLETNATIYNDIILDDSYGQTIDIQRYLDKSQINGFRLTGIDAESYIDTKYYPVRFI